MHPATKSAGPADDLHAILNRFQTWAGKLPENHSGHEQSATGVREIPMEEAMRQLRSRRAIPVAERVHASPPPQAPEACEIQPAPVWKPAAVAECAAPATTKLTSESLPEAKPSAKKKAGAPAVRKIQLVRRGPAGEAKAGKPRPPASVQASETKQAGTRQPDTCKSAKRPRAAGKKSAKTPRKAEFREVLARSVRAEKPKSRQERQQRVSVRLSSAEERLLQKRAKETGLTVSEYLRRSVREAEASRPEEQRNQTEIPKRGSHPAAPSPLFAASTPQNSSGLGGWLSLLRNRFLASPARISERA